MIIVRPEFPNKLARNTKSSFNYALCSQKEYDSKKGYYILRLPKHIRLYYAKTGNVYQPSRDLVLFLLSSDENKKKIKKDGFKLDCDSNKSVLSTECSVTSNPTHIRDATTFVINKYKLDGVAIHHDSFLPKDINCIIHSLTICILEKDLTPLDECDGSSSIIRYSKLHNSAIRKLYPDFPNISQIEKAIIDGKCPSLTKSLYETVYLYMNE